MAYQFRMVDIFNNKLVVCSKIIIVHAITAIIFFVANLYQLIVLEEVHNKVDYIRFNKIRKSDARAEILTSGQMIPAEKRESGGYPPEECTNFGP